MALKDLLTRHPEKWFALEQAVEEGWSLNEIRNTLGIRSRTVKTWYPGYSAFPVGGGGEAQIIRQVNQDMQRLDDHGIMSTRREKR